MSSIKDLTDGIKDDLVRIKAWCEAHGETMAVAESVTAGALQFLLSTTPDALNFFHGGITVYNCAQKMKHLGIEPIYADKCNGVSEKITTELAKNVCTAFACQVGVGITGYATPVKEEGINEIFAFMAAVRDGETLFLEKITPESEAADAQFEYAVAAIKKLAATLNKRP